MGSDGLWDRIDNISKISDTFIYYIRGSSGGGGILNTPNSGYILYMNNGQAKMEYYCWNSTTGVLISKFKSIKKQTNIDAIFRFVFNNYDSLAQYNGSDITTIDHYTYVEYKVKIKDKILFAKRTMHPNLSYYVKNAPMLGYFLIVLNTFYYNYGFSEFLDVP
jgi:hypothetical protein